MLSIGFEVAALCPFIPGVDVEDAMIGRLPIQKAFAGLQGFFECRRCGVVKGQREQVVNVIEPV